MRSFWRPPVTQSEVYRKILVGLSAYPILKIAFTFKQCKESCQLGQKRFCQIDPTATNDIKELLESVLVRSAFNSHREIDSGRPQARSGRLATLQLSTTCQSVCSRPSPGSDSQPQTSARHIHPLRVYWGNTAAQPSRNV